MFLRERKQRSFFRCHLSGSNILALEQLEDRKLLCASSVHYDNEIIVTSNDDEIGGDRVSLRDAVIMANDSGQNTMIVMGTGEHVVSRDDPGAPDEEVGDLDVMNSSPLAVVPSICIAGAGAEQTVIDGQGLNRVLHIHAGVDVHIEGVTIRGGFAADGGGVLNEGALAIVDSELAGNVGQRGGAVHNFGLLSLDGLNVQNNAAVIGGGIYLREDEFSQGSGPTTIHDSTFLDNRATQHGGGIADVRVSFEAVLNGALTVSDTVVRGNHSLLNGGGIYSLGSLNVLRSTIDDNAADREGGGAYYSGGTLKIEGSTFSDNTAAGRGGGLNMRYGDPSIHQSTFSGNIAGRNGGGIFQDDDVNGLSFTQSTVTANIANANATAEFTGTGGGLYLEDNIAMFNTVVAGNFRACSGCESPTLIPNDLGGGLTGSNRASYNLIGAYDGEFEADDIGNVFGSSAMPLDPRLGPLADNGGSTLTHLLLDDSPAIDAGPPPAQNQTPADPFDQRGAPRVIDGNNDGLAVIDIGSFELQPSEINLPPVARDDAYIADGTAQSVWQEAILMPSEETNSFGSSFALDGDRMLVNARDFTAERAGADVYQLRNGVWQRTASLTSDEATSNSFFPVALNGDRAVFADRRDLNDGGGAVYVFENGISGWQRVAKLETPDEAFEQTFGNDVDIDGDRIVVGADGFQLTDSGAAYVYELQDGDWSLAQTLTAPTGTIDDSFGGEVSIEGNRIVVGATYADDPVTFDRTQTIYVFERDDTTWHQAAEITPLVATDHFGFVFDLDGNRLMVSASDVSHDGIYRSGAFIYEHLQGEWRETARVMVSDEPDRRWDDDDVATVAIDGDVAVVGMDHDDDPGAVYVFRSINGEWAQTHRLFSRTPPRREDNFFVAEVDASRIVVNDHDFQEMFVYGLAETGIGTQVLLVAADNGVLHNDSDLDGDPLYPQVVANPRHGRVTMGTDGSFTYAADEGFIGRDSFIYGISDGFEHQDFARVTIEVLPAGPIIRNVIRNENNGVFSELTSLSFVFGEDVVDLNQQDLSLVNETLGTAVDLSQAQMTYAADTDTARWDLAALNLQRSRYTAALTVAGESGATDTLTVPVIIAFPGDANLDGAVDASDFNIWNENRFQIGTDWHTGDFNNDGVTDTADFNRWLTNRWLSVDNIDDVTPLASPAAAQQNPLSVRTPRAALPPTSPLVASAIQGVQFAQRLDRLRFVAVDETTSHATTDEAFSLLDSVKLLRLPRRVYQFSSPKTPLSPSAHAWDIFQGPTRLTDHALADWRDQ